MPCPLQMEKKNPQPNTLPGFLKIISKDLYMQATDFQAQEAPKLMSAAKLTHKSCNSLDSLSNNGMIQDFHLQKGLYLLLYHRTHEDYHICLSVFHHLADKERRSWNGVCLSKFALQLTSPCGSQMSTLNRGRLCHRHR